MKKSFIAIITICIILISAVSCSSATKTVTVQIAAGEGIFLEDKITLPENANAGEYIRQLCNKNDVVIEGVDDGYISKVGEWTNEGDYAWMFYTDDVIAEVGVKDYIPKDGDTIKLSYVNWTELF